MAGAFAAATAAAAAAPASRRHRQERPGRRGRRFVVPVARAATRTIELDSGAVAVAPARRRPKALVHFLGGAFVGAAPAPVYSLLLERLAEGGYTAVATPYAVTFQHLECARAVNAAFEAALRELRGGERRDAWAAPADVPVHGLGHSNGSLLHMLIGSLGQAAPTGAVGINGGSSSSSSSGSGGTQQQWAGQQQSQPQPHRTSNVLISYNNFRVGKAVPVPLGLLAPAVQQLRGGGRLADGAQAALQQAASAAEALLLSLPGGGIGGLGGGSAAQQQLELLRGLQQWDPAVVQLGSVFDEVGDGSEDFSPSPEEARRLISAAYCVPNTLLVQFSNDDTDETPAAAAMLAGPLPGAGSQLSANGSGAAGGGGSGRPQRQVQTLVLPGTHVTPCGPADAGWRLPPGAGFGPAEALGMAARAVLQADTNRLADRVLAYLDELS